MGEECLTFLHWGAHRIPIAPDCPARHTTAAWHYALAVRRFLLVSTFEARQPRATLADDQRTLSEGMEDDRM
jgi:hypothetical protein